MRYIKLFENFSNIDKTKLKENIEACLVELSDKGFEITTIIDNKYINVEIVKGYNENDFLHHSDDFELHEIEDEIKQVCDYISEMYDDIIFEYITETRFDNTGYSKLEEIPDGLDLIRFDLYVHTEKGPTGLRTYENYEQEPDKDWGNDGFETNKEELKKRVQDIFVELVDEGYLVDVEVSFLSINVHINRLEDNVYEDGIFIDNELVGNCAEEFVEYIRDRNPKAQNELGLGVRYEVNYGQQAMHRSYIYDNFPGPEWDNKIVDLKIVLSI
jgi:hypothetical protein